MQAAFLESPLLLRKQILNFKGFPFLLLCLIYSVNEFNGVPPPNIYRKLCTLASFHNKMENDKTLDLYETMENKLRDVVRCYFTFWHFLWKKFLWVVATRKINEDRGYLLRKMSMGGRASHHIPQLFFFQLFTQNN